MTRQKNQKTTPAAEPEIAKPVEETQPETVTSVEEAEPGDAQVDDNEPAAAPAEELEVEVVDAFVVTHGAILGLGDRPRRKGELIYADEITEKDLALFLGDGTLVAAPAVAEEVSAE
jgi:hypothetical protein